MAPNVSVGPIAKLSEATGRGRSREDYDSSSLDLEETGHNCYSNGVKVPSKLHKGLLVQTAIDLKPKPQLSAMVNSFGRYATDHMLQIKWKRGEGWGPPSIKPVQPFQLHPFAQVFHYALTCFEGMKVYKDAQGHGRLFRPMMNMDRFMVSASRLDLPEFDKEALLSYIKHLVKMDEEWIPGHEGYSLYVRPTIMATAALLGLAPPEECLLYVVMTPCGAYPNTSAEGFRELAPIKVLVSMEHVRAWPGGVGYAKVGGNYAPAILPQLEAVQFGCSQVLYVRRNECEGNDGIVGECGAMNFFAFMQSKDGSLELVTPVLDGTILPGVTRDSVLSLCREWREFSVSERTLQFQELVEASEEGRLLEMFGTGTACGLQPISELKQVDGPDLTAPFDVNAASYWMVMKRGQTMERPKVNEPVSLCARLLRTLLDIQHGHVEHNGWSVLAEEI